MIEVVAAGLGSAALVYGYHRLTGCPGGHVWSDWESVDRFRVTPYGHGDRVSVERKQERHCEASGCYEHDEQYVTVRENIYSTSFERALDSVREVEYECPQCKEAIPDSERNTRWVGVDYGGGQTRHEQCPQCGHDCSASFWDRQGWDE